MKRLILSVILAVAGLVALPAPAQAACVGVTVNPGTGNLEAALSGNSGPTTYCLTSSSTNYVESANPLSLETGDTLKGPSAGAKIVPSATNVEPFNDPGVDTVTLDHLRILGAMTTPVSGNICASLGIGINTGTDWVMNTVEVSGFECGVKFGYQESGSHLTGTSTQMSKVHDNLRYGVIGSAHPNIEVDNTEIYANNTYSSDDGNFDEGGTKFSAENGLLFHDNNVHDNNGHGVWLDESASNAEVWNNTVTGQNAISGGDGEGIRDEISCNNDIHDNTVNTNDQGQIDIVSSYGSTVTDNTVVSTTGEDFSLQINADGRGGNGYHDGCSGSYQASATFTTNDVTTTATYAAREIDNGTFSATWTGNVYHNGCSFNRWDTDVAAAGPFAAWQAASRDTGGSCT